MDEDVGTTVDGRDAASTSRVAATPDVVTEPTTGRTGVLLVHGLGGTPAELSLLARRLRVARCQVEVIVLPGHGGSLADLARSRVEEWRAACIAAHARLAQSCASVVVGGLSMGALLALDLACLRPKGVHGVVLLAPTLRLDGWSMPRAARFAGWLPPSLVPPSIMLAERAPYGLKDRRVRAMVLAHMRAGDVANGGHFRTPLRSLGELGRLAAGVDARLGQIRQPALVVHARTDDVADVSGAFRLARRLGGPVELHVLDDSYHLVTIDRQRAQVATAVSRFVQGLELAAAGAVTSPDHGGRTHGLLH